MKARLLKKIRSDKRLIIEKKFVVSGYQYSGWWYLSDTKINKSVRHKRLRNILNEYVKLSQVQRILYWMLYAFIALILMCFVLVFTSCQKQVIKPSGEVYKNAINLYDYRAYNLNSGDTAILTINGNNVNATKGYQHTINSGDTISLYYSSQKSNYNFAIWNAGNFEIASTIKYFYPTIKRYVGTIYLSDGLSIDNYSGKTIDSTLIYRYIIKASYIQTNP